MLISGINANGQVGAHFMTHNFGWFTSILPEATNRSWALSTHRALIDDFTSDSCPKRSWRALGITSYQRDGDLQPIEAYHLMDPGVKRWARFKHGCVTTTRTCIGCTRRPPTSRTPALLDLDPNIKDRWGQPTIRITHEWEDHDANSVTS